MQCENCGRKLKKGDECYFASDNSVNCALNNNMFCSEDCLTEYIGIDFYFIGEEQ